MLPDCFPNLSAVSGFRRLPGDRGRLGSTLTGGGLHEIYAEAGPQAVAAEGFGLGLAVSAAGCALMWIQHGARHEAGELYGPGLHEWGLKTSRVLLVRVSSATALLAAGEEALRSGATGAVLMSGWGEARAFGLTASRRLVRAAAQGGTTAILTRAAAAPQPSAATTRWSVEAAPSRTLDARAPGRPAFKVKLLRSRAGLAPGEWIMEWDRESRSFVDAAAPGRLVSVSVGRSAGVRAA